MRTRKLTAATREIARRADLQAELARRAFDPAETRERQFKSSTYSIVASMLPMHRLRDVLNCLDMNEQFCNTAERDAIADIRSLLLPLCHSR